MGFFDSKEKKEILRRRDTQKKVVDLDDMNYIGLNKLAKTFIDESNLPEMKDKDREKFDCLENAVKYLSQNIFAVFLIKTGFPEHPRCARHSLLGKSRLPPQVSREKRRDISSRRCHLVA